MSDNNTNNITTGGGGEVKGSNVRYIEIVCRIIKSMLSLQHS